MKIRKLKDAGAGIGFGNSRRVFQRQVKAKRPGRRPGRVIPERVAAALLLLGCSLGLSFLRSHVNLSILEASQNLAECRRVVASSEREVDRTRVSVERLAAIDHIEPQARKTGFGRPPAEAVMLLAARASAPFPEARPLGLPGAGALGRWLGEAAKAARVPAAAAAPGEAGRRAGPSLRGARAQVRRVGRGRGKHPRWSPPPAGWIPGSTAVEGRGVNFAAPSPPGKASSISVLGRALA